jgi:hypothetical protein
VEENATNLLTSTSGVSSQEFTIAVYESVSSADLYLGRLRQVWGTVGSSAVADVNVRTLMEQPLTRRR